MRHVIQGFPQVVAHAWYLSFRRWSAATHAISWLARMFLILKATGSFYDFYHSSEAVLNPAGEEVWDIYIVFNVLAWEDLVLPLTTSAQTACEVISNQSHPCDKLVDVWTRSGCYTQMPTALVANKSSVSSSALRYESLMGCVYLGWKISMKPAEGLPQVFHVYTLVQWQHLWW